MRNYKASLIYMKLQKTNLELYDNTDHFGDQEIWKMCTTNLWLGSVSCYIP